VSKLPFPEDVLKQHSVFLGKTGSGKSSKCRLVVEHLLDAGKRVCIVDPKGDWWGLKSTADGKGVAYPDVVMFGNFTDPDATDIPINKHSGAQVAELVASGNRPCVIGFAGWYTSDMVQFWIDFAATLFSKNRGELFLFLDEFHNFAPKGKIMDPQAGKCLHWSNRLLSEGRGLGIVCLMASQRPQKVHNDALTSAETLFALRMIHAADRGAVQEWIKGCGDNALGKVILDSLAGMKREDGYVWSPEIEFGPSKITFPMFKTFDSFAPPQLQKKVHKSGWKDVDLTEVREKMAKVLEEHKANDPAELKRTISELRKKVMTLEIPQPVARETVNVSVLTDDDNKRLERLISQLELNRRDVDELVARAEGLHGEVIYFRNAMEPLKQSLQPARRVPLNEAPKARSYRPLSAPIPAAPRSLPVSHAYETSELPKMRRAFLTILAQYAPEPLSKNRMLALTEYAASGPVSKEFATLVREGYAEPSGNGLRITKFGEGVLGEWTPLPVGEELRQNVMNGNRLNTMEKAFMKLLFNLHPSAVSKKELLEMTNYAASGPVSKAFARLVRLEFAVQDGPAMLRAHDNFFV
jgi:hypothetical protein